MQQKLKGCHEVKLVLMKMNRITKIRQNAGRSYEGDRERGSWVEKADEAGEAEAPEREGRIQGCHRSAVAQVYHAGDCLYLGKLSGLLGVKSARLESSWYLKRPFSFQNTAPSLDHGCWHRPFGPSRTSFDFFPMTLTLLCTGL